MFNPQSFGQMIPGYGFRSPVYPQPNPQQTIQQMMVTPVTGMAQVEASQAPFDGTPMFFYDTSANAVYALYTDYCKVAKKYGVDKVDFWADLAKAFMRDKDAGEGKVKKYYEFIAKHDED